MQNLPTDQSAGGTALVGTTVTLRQHVAGEGHATFCAHEIYRDAHGATVSIREERDFGTASIAIHVETSRDAQPPALRVGETRLIGERRPTLSVAAVSRQLRYHRIDESNTAHNLACLKS